MIRLRLAVFLVTVCALSFAADKPTKYWRVGNAQDITTKTTPGYALMGGGADQDAAFQFLCEHSGGGDFLILRASGDDDYNPYVQKLCKQNSVATLLVDNANSANDPMVAETIRKAEALFIAGGDQANYVKFWKPSPMRAAMQELVDRGVPVGGTSAGLAILGEFAFSALNDTAYSEVTLKNPYDNTVTIDHGFLTIPHLEDTITDTHFKKRDRLGRSLVFEARILQDGMARQIHEIAVDEKSVFLLNADGTGKVIGAGTGVYFYRPTAPPETCKANVPLTFLNIAVYHAPTGGTFDLNSWTGTGGEGYTLSVQDGVIRSTSGSKY
ncbi:MAG TPA: cyanophycinase [Candidatus Koribacter sp.]|jgi:cyanophycinase-like exopeptidase